MKNLNKDVRSRYSGKDMDSEQVLNNIKDGVYVKEAEQILKNIDYNDSLEFVKIANERFKLEKQEKEQYLDDDSVYIPSDESISSNKMRRIIASRYTDIK